MLMLHPKSDFAWIAYTFNLSNFLLQNIPGFNDRNLSINLLSVKCKKFCNKRLSLDILIIAYRTSLVIWTPDVPAESRGKVISKRFVKLSSNQYMNKNIISASLCADIKLYCLDLQRETLDPRFQGDPKLIFFFNFYKNVFQIWISHIKFELFIFFQILKIMLFCACNILRRMVDV